MTNNLWSCPFSPDSKRFVFTARIRNSSGREDWRIKVFEWATGRDLCTLVDLGDEPRPLAFDPTGGRLAMVTGRRGGKEASVLRIREVDGGKEVFAIPLPGQEILSHEQRGVQPGRSPPRGPDEARRSPMP